MSYDVFRDGATDLVVESVSGCEIRIEVSDVEWSKAFYSTPNQAIEIGELLLRLAGGALDTDAEHRAPITCGQLGLCGDDDE